MPEPTDRTRLTRPEVAEQAPPGFRQVGDALEARFRTGSFRTGLELVDRIGAAAEEQDHHPDVDLRYGYVAVRLLSHDVGGITSRDVALARTIGAIAGELDVPAEP